MTTSHVIRRITLAAATVSVLSINGATASAQISALTPTATTVSSWPNPSTPGLAVTFTSLVFTGFSPFLPRATGTVSFGEEFLVTSWWPALFPGTPDFSFLTTGHLGASSVVSGGAQFEAVVPALAPVAFPLVATPTGRIFACYSGDAFYAASCGVMNVGMVQANTTLTLTSFPALPRFDDYVQFTAQVTAIDGTATGAVRFEDTTTGAFLGSVNLDANSRADLPTSLLGLGSHVIRATYGGQPPVYSPSQATLSLFVRR